MNSNMLEKLMGMGQKPQTPTPIDPQRFNQLAQQLTKENLVQLVQQARTQGISEDQIEQGLNYLLGLK